MDKHLKLLEDAIRQARIAAHELQMARPNEPRLARANRLVLAAVMSLQAVELQTIELAVELERLKGLGLEL